MSPRRRPLRRIERQQQPARAVDVFDAVGMFVTRDVVALREDAPAHVLSIDGASSQGTPEQPLGCL